MSVSGVFERVEYPNGLMITFSTGMVNVDKACDVVMGYLKGNVPQAGPHLFAINLAMREGLTNAVRHGNRYDPETLIFLRMSLESRNMVVLTIQDQGKGFSWQEADACIPDDGSDHGRGLAIMRAYCTDYSFNQKGNILTLKKKLSS